jgi:cytochrome P450
MATSAHAPLPAVVVPDARDRMLAEQFPLGAGLRIEELDAFDNSALLRELREREPVTWCRELQAWLVTSRALVDEVILSPERFTVNSEANPNAKILGVMMLSLDGDDHGRHRAPFQPAFKLKAISERFTSVVEQHVDRLLARFEHDDHVELASQFANPFAVGVAGDLLGLTFDKADEVHDIYNDFAAGIVGYRDPDAVRTAFDARDRLKRLLMEGIDELRATPDGSLLSSVLHGEARLSSDEELLANLRLVLFGAIETVESMILNTTWALLHHPDQLQSVRDDPARWADTVQEGLRWCPPVGYGDRWAVEDTTLGDAEITRGEYVIPVFESANRDPSIFPDPDRFDISRANNRRNYSFSKGHHMCIGVNLARLQGEIALRELFARVERLELDPANPVEPTGFNFRRPPHLHLRWSRES